MQEASLGEKERTKTGNTRISPEGLLLELPRLATRGAETAAVKNGIPSAEKQAYSLVLMIRMYGIPDVCF
jgi:hypothetical protein